MKTQPVEILCRFDPEPNKPDRFVGQQADEKFVLLEVKPSGALEQIGKAVSFEEGMTVATAALDRDARALTSPNALHMISLVLVGAAWSKAAARAEADKADAAKAAEAERRADEIRAAKAGGQAS